MIHQQVQHSQILLSAHTAFTCIVLISERTAISALYNVNCLVFITKMRNVYCMVQTGSLNKTIYTSCLKGSFITWFSALFPSCTFCFLCMTSYAASVCVCVCVCIHTHTHTQSVKTNKTWIFHSFNHHIHNTKLHFHLAVAFVTAFVNVPCKAYWYLQYYNRNITFTGYHKKLTSVLFFILHFAFQYSILLLPPQMSLDRDTRTHPSFYM